MDDEFRGVLGAAQQLAAILAARQAAKVKLLHQALFL